MNHDDLERRLIDLIPRLERIAVLQENVEERCCRRLERIREIEEHQDSLDEKISALQEQNAVLSETLDAFRDEHKKLAKLIKGMIALLVLTLMVLSFIGVEAFPFLFEVIKKLVI